MKVCGVEIKSNEVLLCLLTKQDDVFDIRDVRQTRFTLSNSDEQESIQKFQFDFSKLMQDYGIEAIAIKQRPQKGKFAGSAVGFKIEAALQLIKNIDVAIVTGQQAKATLKRHPLPIEYEQTGLKKFQEGAFMTAFTYIYGHNKFDVYTESAE